MRPARRPRFDGESWRRSRPSLACCFTVPSFWIALGPHFRWLNCDGADSPDVNPRDRRCRLYRLARGAPPARARAGGGGVDSMELGHRAAVGDVPLVKGDVGDPKAVVQTVERFGVDAVVHFAAYKSPGESMSKPERYFGNNVAGSASLIETLHRVGVGRIVFSSTCAVYGTSEHVPVGEDARSNRRAPTGRARP